jgi:hypothetical protein
MKTDKTCYGPGGGVVFGETDISREPRRRWDDRMMAMDWVWTIAIILLLLGFGALFGYAARAYAETPTRRVVAQPTAAEKRWIEQRHKYHGIYGSIEENGEYYFYRDGKKCRL